MEDKKERSLEGLKGVLACVIALFVHYGHFYPQRGYPKYMSYFPFLISYGWLAVELYFMISGFGMNLGYGIKLQQGKIGLKEYLGKRLRKIYPMYFIALIVTTMLQIMHAVQNGETLRYKNLDIYHFFLHVFLLQTGLFEVDWPYFGPSWFLSVLYVCYIYFYLVENKVKSKMAYIVGIICAIAGILSGWNMLILNVLIFRGIASFSVGVILGEIYKSKEKYNSKLLGYFFLGVLVLLYFIWRKWGDNVVGNIQLLFIIIVGPMLIWVCLFVPFVKKLLSCKIMVWLGSISMGIYLWHFPIQCLLKICDARFNLGISYEASFFSFGYMVGVIGTAILYKWVSLRYESFFIKIISSIIYR